MPSIEGGGVEKNLFIISNYLVDKIKDISLITLSNSFKHKFNKKIDIGATWVYGTGNALTFPQGVYLGMMQEFGDKVTAELVESYGSRNSTRLPSYHRLDFAINKHRKKENWESTWTLGAYNLYNRKNPFFAYLAYEDDQRVAKQVSLFPIIPSISYRIQF